jgi:hypothetical protein
MLSRWPVCREFIESFEGSRVPLSVEDRQLPNYAHDPAAGRAASEPSARSLCFLSEEGPRGSMASTGRAV